MDGLVERNDTVTQQLLTTPFDKKWEILKPEIEKLYYGHGLEHIKETMKLSYGFSAK